MGSPFLHFDLGCSHLPENSILFVNRPFSAQFSNCCNSLNFEAKIWFGTFLWPSDQIYSWQFIQTPCRFIKMLLIFITFLFIFLPGSVTSTWSHYCHNSEFVVTQCWSEWREGTRRCFLQILWIPMYIVVKTEELYCLQVLLGRADGAQA